MWVRKNTIFYGCILLFAIRLYILCNMSDSIIEFNNIFNNIPLILWIIVIIYILIYGIILGYINKYTIVSNLLIRIILCAVLIILCADYMQCLSLLDLCFNIWITSVGSVRLIDNFGEWYFIKPNPYGEGSSSGPNYTKGSGNFGGLNEQDNSEGSNGPNKPDSNSAVPADDNTENNRSKKRKSIDESTYIITNYENLKPELKKNMKWEMVPD